MIVRLESIDSAHHSAPAPPKSKFRKALECRHLALATTRLLATPAWAERML